MARENPHQDARLVIQDIISDGKIMNRDHDLDPYLSPNVVLPAMEEYARLKVYEARKTQGTIDWNACRLGIVIAVFLMALFTVVFQPATWLFTHMSDGRALIAYGMLIILMAILGGTISQFISDRKTRR